MNNDVEVEGKVNKPPVVSLQPITYTYYSESATQKGVPIILTQQQYVQIAKAIGKEETVIPRILTPFQKKQKEEAEIRKEKFIKMLTDHHLDYLQKRVPLVLTQKQILEKDILKKNVELVETEYQKKQVEKAKELSKKFEDRFGTSKKIKELLVGEKIWEKIKK